MTNVRLLTAAVMGLAFGLIGGATEAYQSSGVGVVTALSGPVSMIRGSAEPQTLKFRDQLQWRDVVETKKDGITRILLLGKTSVTVRELSRLELREEALAAGNKYTVSVVSGKVRATVERSLMGKGDEVEVHSPNAVAAVRGTDFVVEIQDQPARAQAFGMLASREIGPLLAQAPTGLGTLVYTLTGQVNVTNPRAAARVTVQLGALEGARIQGAANPVRFTFTRLDIPNIVRDLNPPAPPAARRPVASDTAKGKAEQFAATETTRTGERPGAVTPVGGGPAVTSAGGRSQGTADGAPATTGEAGVSSGAGSGGGGVAVGSGSGSSGGSGGGASASVSSGSSDGGASKSVSSSSSSSGGSSSGGGASASVSSGSSSGGASKSVSSGSSSGGASKSVSSGSSGGGASKSVSSGSSGASSSASVSSRSGSGSGSSYRGDHSSRDGYSTKRLREATITKELRKQGKKQKDD